MSKRNTAALALTTPIAANLDLKLTAEQQNALVLNQVRIQQEESVCKAALHQIKAKLDADISHLNSVISALKSTLADQERAITSSLDDFAKREIGSTYALLIPVLAGLNHKATSTFIHTGLTRVDADAHSTPGTGHYTIDLACSISIETPGRGYNYDGTVCLTTKRDDIMLPGPLQSLLAERDSTRELIASTESDRTTLQTKRDSLWQMEDEMKARLAIKSIQADPSQADALAETTAFLMSKLGLGPSSPSDTCGMSPTPAAKKVRNSKR